MVQRKVLEKLSNRELEKYLTPNSSFTSEAEDLAFKILQERGHPFTPDEKANIQKLIDNKRSQEQEIQNIEKDVFIERNLTENPNDIALYPFYWIFLSTLFLSSIFGGVLLVYNFIKLKKIVPTIGVLIIALALFFLEYSIDQTFIYELLKENSTHKSRLHRATPEMLIRIISSLIFLLFWHSIIKENNIKYRSSTIIFPVILALLVLSIMLILEFKIIPF